MINKPSKTLIGAITFILTSITIVFILIGDGNIYILKSKLYSFLGNSDESFYLYSKYSGMGNKQKAIPFLEKCIEQNNPPYGAFFLLATEYYNDDKKSNDRKAYSILKHSADIIGNKNAKLFLADVLYEGNFGISIDKAQAVSYYKDFITKIDENYSTSYGRALYRIGDDFLKKRNYDKAYDYFLDSALNGWPQAVFSLENSFRTGEGCEKDTLKADKLGELGNKLCRNEYKLSEASNQITLIIGISRNSSKEVKDESK